LPQPGKLCSFRLDVVKRRLSAASGVQDAQIYD
jgi:hypothetical protein